MDIKDEPYHPVKSSLSRKLTTKNKKLTAKQSKLQQLKKALKIERPKRSPSISIPIEEEVSPSPFHLKFPRKAIRGQSTDDLMPPPSTNVIPDLSVLKQSKKKLKLSSVSIDPTTSVSGNNFKLNIKSCIKLTFK